MDDRIKPEKLQPMLAPQVWYHEESDKLLTVESTEVSGDSVYFWGQIDFKGELIDFYINESDFFEQAGTHQIILVGKL